MCVCIAVFAVFLDVLVVLVVFIVVFAVVLDVVVDGWLLQYICPYWLVFLRLLFLYGSPDENLSCSVIYTNLDDNYDITSEVVRITAAYQHKSTYLIFQYSFLLLFYLRLSMCDLDFAPRATVVHPGQVCV